MPPIRKNVQNALGYVPGEQPIDTTTIKLNTNENPYPPSPKVMDAIRCVTPEQLRKYPSPSGQPFREAAAKIHNVPPDWILPFNGGDELLSVAIRAAAGENETVAFLEPSYSLYPVLIEMNDSWYVRLRYDIDGTNWSLPTDIAQAPANVLLIVNPNAPSGHLDPLDRLESIAKNFKGLLVIDEAYVDFAPVNALPLVKQFANVLLLRTLSKGYSLAGLRFGYAIAQPSLLKQLEKVRDSYPVDAIAIAAATAAIQDQDYAQSTWQKVIAERTRLSAALKQMGGGGFQMPDSHSNFVLATVPSTTKSPSPELFAQSLYQSLKDRGILVRYWDLPKIADKLRITIGTPEQNNKLLAELKNLL